MAIASVAASAASKAKSKAKEKAQSATKKPAKGRTRSEVVTDVASRGIGNRPKYWEPKSVAGYRRILTAEFIVCMVVLIGQGFHNPSGFTGTWWKKIASVWFIFFTLAIAATVSWKVARIAAALGGLVTLTLVLSKESDVLGIIQQFGTSFGSQNQQQPQFLGGGGGSF